MRLFIAICLPREVKRQLAEYAAALAAAARRARVTREDNFHLTLAFLGEALPPEAAATALDAVTAAPFKLYSDQPGAFSRGSSEIYWLGLKESRELRDLHADLSAALQEVGFSPEQRPFSPHLTLARDLRGLVAEALPPPPRFIVAVTGLTLMESTQADGLLTYVPRHQKQF